jgi:hypothetical protein
MDNAQVMKQAFWAITSFACNTANKAVLHGNMELRGALLLYEARYPDEPMAQQAMTNLSSRTISGRPFHASYA